MGTIHDIGNGSKKKDQTVKPIYSFDADEFSDDDEESMPKSEKKDVKNKLAWIKELASHLPDNFIHRSGSSRKESVVYSFRVPLWFQSEIMQIIETKCTPYKRSSEFVKSAVFLFIQLWANKLEKMKAGKKLLINTQKRLLSDLMAQREEAKSEYGAFVKKFESDISKSVVENDIDEVRETVNEFFDLIDSLDENKWIKKYTERVELILKNHNLKLSDFRKGK